MTKNKLFILSVFALFNIFTNHIQAQTSDSTTIIKFHVMEAFDNETNITENALLARQYLQLEVFDNPNIYDMFYNVQEKNNTSSFGKIVDLQSRVEKDEKNNEFLLLKFTWNYQNTYNSDLGFCNVLIVLNQVDNISVFTIEMKTDKGYTLSYGGIAKFI